MPPRPAVILVHYGPPDLTLRCLASLASTEPEPHTVVVVDHGPGEGLAQALAGAHPALTILANPANPGFTAPGLVGSDAIGGVTYTYASSATPTAPLGSTHGITPGNAVFSAGSAANYIITYLAGTLTIAGN